MQCHAKGMPSTRRLLHLSCGLVGFAENADIYDSRILHYGRYYYAFCLRPSIVTQ